MLIAHYKLDDLTDNSGNNLTLIQGTGTSTTTVAGRIGNCQSFGGASYLKNTDAKWASIFPSYYNSSFSVYVKYNAIINYPCIIGFSNLNYDSDVSYTLITYSGKFAIQYNTSTGGWAYLSSNFTPTTGVWYHVVVTTDVVGNVRFYIDGVLDSSTTTLPAAYSYSRYLSGFGIIMGCDTPGGDEYLNGYIDDVRIYNHVLSPKEVKELSKAKVLHYNFDDFQEPTTNLYTSQVNSINDWLNSGTAPTINNNDTSIGKPLNIPAEVNVRSCTLTATASYQFGRANISVTEGNTYTLSTWYCQTAVNNSSTPYARSNTDANLGALIWEGNGSTNSSTWPLNQWIKLYKTFTAITGQTGVYISSYPNFSTYPNTMFMTAPQLEQKDHATPFVNGSRTGVIHDVSGYNNDATLALATAPQWYEDGIGKGCYRFNGATFQTITTSLTATQLASLTTCSISFWRKSTALASWLPFKGQTTSEYLMATSGGTGAFYHSNTAGTKTIYVDGVVSTTPSTELTKWHHYVITDVNLSTWTSLFFGGYSTGEWLLEGDYDDVRIYNTVLTQSDVTELYQTRANLDNVGNLFTKNISLPDDVTSGLTNYWNFDANAVDSVSGNNGTVTGATLTSGIINGAYSFNGSSNYITLASTINLSSNANWSVCVWVKTTDAYSSILTNSSGGPVSSGFGINTGKINYSHYNAGWYEKTGNIAINTGNWTMLTWINRSNATMDMYVNGVLDYGNFSSICGLGPVNEIGKGFASDYFAGTMDDFRIYNRCLTLSEIKLLYSKGFR